MTREDAERILADADLIVGAEDVQFSVKHVARTITAALMGTTGIARRAGQLKATSRMAASISGKKGKQG